MKNKYFNIFIILLGIFTAYVFYALWHTEELNSLPQPSISKKQSIEDLTNKRVISKDSKDLLPPTTSLESLPKHKEPLPFKTKEILDTQTQTVYESLIPENMEEADVAIEEEFAAFEEKVAREDEENRELEQLVTEEDVNNLP